MRNPLSLVLNRSPVPYSDGSSRSTGFMSLFGLGGKKHQMEQMGINGTLFSIINKTSTTTASVEWHLGRDKEGATCKTCGVEGHELVTQHQALKVLNKPNDFFTRQELFESGQQHIDLAGEGWTVVGYSSYASSLPLELWNVRPDRIEIVTSPTEFILGYIYRGPNGEEVPLERKEMLSIRMPDPLDPYRGLGPVQSILRNIDSARYSSEWNRNFFKNNATPGGVIQVTQRMQDREWKQFLERWRESHQGVSNAARVGVLEGGAEWIDVKQSQRDMQFVEIANLDKTTIREAFGMPKFAVGDVDDVNRATAEASDVWYGKTITVPRLDRWKGMLNNDFLPLFPSFDPRLKFHYANPVPVDKEAEREEKKAKVEVYVQLVNAGVHPDDAAAIAGLPPMRIIVRSEPVPQEAVA